MEGSNNRINASFQDEILECVDCHQEFTFSAGEQSYFASKGLAKVKRCPECRLSRKQTLHPPMNVGEALARAHALFPSNNHWGVH